MYFVTVGIMIVGGILGASSLIVAKKPDAQELIEKLSPYQGWIGLVMFCWGVWDTIHLILNLGWYMKHAIVIMAVLIFVIVVELGLGFLLGYNLIVKYFLGKNKEALEKGNQIRAKLAKFQGPLGAGGIAVGILYLVVRFVF